ncbi:MAG: tRNA (N(6)-L-threonylcarbamoyladenosine(37)-C(2))-methylthiotransferase MtaB, partial [Lachnospiraceae bacterium]|nr:tRNA (N(6)-L-threonylcarbamoyladenosine(37)-C(2))-methylthiotransferase MtaB [Lachnospiraceae bacterium]
GCKTNAYETDVMQQELQQLGYKIVPFDDVADIYVVNTCSVTNIADHKSRQMLHQAKKRNPKAIVVAAGCYVQTGKETLEKDPLVDLLLGNNLKGKLGEALEAYFEEQGGAAKEPGVVPAGGRIQADMKSRWVEDINEPHSYEDMLLLHTGGHTRAEIKIQDGCNQFCTYCVIPFARGRNRSRKPEAILEEVRKIAEAGYKEIVLTGIHISSYGLDFDGKTNVKKGESFPCKHLLALLREIHEVEGIERIRLGSFEPRIITEEFVDALAGMPKICHHFHLSLQSGCDSVLERMNRHYTTAEYRDSVALLREKLGNPAITTDVIVGFPGETEEEFETTVKYLEEINFYEMHVFPYSRRAGTPADRMGDQLTKAVKEQRVHRLMELRDQQSKAFRESYIGTTQPVLFEESKVIDGITYQMGHTKEYIEVAYQAEEDLKGEILDGVLAEDMGNGIIKFEIG